VQVVGCLTLYLIFLHGIKMKIIHYHVHKIPTLSPTLSQINPINALPKYSLLVPFQYHSGKVLKVVSPSSLPTKTLYISLLSPIHATCPDHLTFLDYLDYIWRITDHESPDTKSQWHNTAPCKKG